MYRIQNQLKEVDAYVFSEIAANAGHIREKHIALGNNLGLTGEGQPLYELNLAFLTLADAEVPESDQIIFCSNAFYNMLRNTPELVKSMRQTEYGENVKFTIGEYEGRDIVAVPTNRFKTMIKLLNGGYGWDANSQDINFIVCAKSAIYHVTKYDKVRVFNPGVVQDFDGYKVNVRIYHDLFIPHNKKPAVYVCVDNNKAAAASSERTLTVAHTLGSDKKLTVTAYGVAPTGDLVGGLIATKTAVNVGDAIPSDAVMLEVGKPTAALSGTYAIYGVENGKVVTGKAVNLSKEVISIVA